MKLRKSALAALFAGVLALGGVACEGGGETETELEGGGGLEENGGGLEENGGGLEEDTGGGLEEDTGGDTGTDTGGDTGTDTGEGEQEEDSTS